MVPPDRWWKRLLRRETRIALDLGMLSCAFFLAYLLRFEFDIPSEFWRAAWIQLPLVVSLQFLALRSQGTYRSLWRYTGLTDLPGFVKAATYSGVILLALRVLRLPESLSVLQVPISIILMATVFAHAGTLGLRVLRRWIYERFESRRRAFGAQAKPVLLVGAGHAGVMAAREIRGRDDTDQELIGFLDDDPIKQGAKIAGLEVLGSTHELAALLRRVTIGHVAITIADPDPELVRRVVDQCEPTKTRVQMIPGLYEILQGRVSVSRFRDLQIEDLLGRDPVRMDQQNAASFLFRKVVLVTGAGGSIGSEIARQVARLEPSRLVLVERAEGSLFEIERELVPRHPELEIRALVGDVGDEARMRSILEDFHPQVIFHAAAHKHVPLMETNPSEAVQNNVFASESIGRLAGEHGVEAFVLLSTDKAVRPRSVMGASKRMAELVMEDLAERFDTRYVAVRFGNVLDSAGSVVPIFRQQIKKGGPVTVTDPRATRYFMTIPEAVQLVLEAGALGSSGDVMILDMGEPVKILDLAEAMIRLTGHAPGQIDIVYTGLRPGEKLFEELLLDEETSARTVHPRIFVGKLKKYPREQIQAALKTLRDPLTVGSNHTIRQLLTQLIPEAQLASADRALVAHRSQIEEGVH